MKIHYIFYTIGVLFIFSSVWYFAREFITELPNELKTLLLVFFIIIFFALAEIFRGGDK